MWNLLQVTAVLTSAKVTVHIRKLVWLKNSHNMEEKDKTKPKPLRESPAD